MKLLFVTTISATLRAFLLPFAEHFRKLGWQVDAMASGVTHCPDCSALFDHLHEIQWTRNPLQLIANLMQAPGRIRAVVESGNYDIVHVHTPVAAFVTRWALRNIRKTGKPKVIYTAHGFHFHPMGNPLRNAVFLGLEKIAGRWTDYLVTINRTDERAAVKHGVVPPERVIYMPGIGVNLSDYDPSKVSSEDIASLRSELQLAPEDVLMLMIAEFNPGKRHRDAFHALALTKNKKIHLALAGTGPLQKHLEELALQLGIRERIHFLGRRNDIPRLIRASVATILPSEREGLPRCIMESLCLETPVIGANIRGIRDLLESGCGLLTPVGDISALAASLDYIMENPEQAVEMGRKGRELMAQEYDIRRIVRLHERLYSGEYGKLGSEPASVAEAQPVTK